VITRLTFADGSDQRVPAQIRAATPVIVAALAERLTLWMLRLQQKIQGEKLSGQVLQHRSGRLYGSIIEQPTEQVGLQLIGSVTGAGGPAWYGQLHETGGTFHVKEYVRHIAFNQKGEVIRMLTKAGTVRKAVATTKEQIVHAHDVTFPERSFMSSSLAEIAEEMVADLQRTAGASLQ